MNPLVPAAVVLIGLAVALAGHRFVGVGLALGACLAFLNGVLLSRRVDLAAAAGDLARAMLIMQLSLLVACSIIGVATVILVRISLALAVASAAGFALTHFGILGAFYLAHGRADTALEGKTS
ncbi:MAG: hypothetical protein JOZ41_16170 [Chloroflexi bacterium]|nr:hypothetical protein [Chloroflexota bacterium]